MLIGCLAGIFTTVVFGWAQDLQRGSSEATDYPIFVPFFDGVSIFKPLEADVRSVLGVTFKPGLVANVDLQWSDSVFDHRLHCVLGKTKDRVSKEKQLKWKDELLFLLNGIKQLSWDEE